MSDSEHAGKIISDLVLRLVLAVHGVDKLVKGLLDRIHIDLVLDVHALSQLICHIPIDILARRDQVLLDPRQRVMLLHIQVNNLVRNDTHSLER